MGTRRKVIGPNSMPSIWKEGVSQKFSGFQTNSSMDFSCSFLVFNKLQVQPVSNTQRKDPSAVLASTSTKPLSIIRGVFTKASTEYPCFLRVERLSQNAIFLFLKSNNKLVV